MKATLKILFFTVLIVLTGFDIHYAEDLKKEAAKDTTKVEEVKKMKDSKDLFKDKATVNISNEEWKKVLSPEAYHVTREKGTERAFTGKYWDFFEKGTYECVCCGAKLFDSSTKFESGCGWPSFSKAIAQGNIIEKTDTSFGMTRTEIVCKKCGAHLGHVFKDGPPPTGLRYCINSAALKFVAMEDN